MILERTWSAASFRNVRLKLFFNRLPPACFISEPEFFIGGEFVPFSDSESACSVVMDTMFGDEFDDSDSETETERRPCGVVGRASDYRWWFDSPLVRR